MGKSRQAEVVRRVHRSGVGDGDHLRPSERRTAAGASVDERARCAASANRARAAPTVVGADRDEPVRRADHAAAVTDSGRHSRRPLALADADCGDSYTDPGRHARRADDDDDDSANQLDATSKRGAHAERIVNVARETESGLATHADVTANPP